MYKLRSVGYPLVYVKESHIQLIRIAFLNIQDKKKHPIYRFSVFSELEYNNVDLTLKLLYMYTKVLCIYMYYILYYLYVFICTHYTISEVNITVIVNANSN